MAQNKIYKFRDIVEATLFLNGAVTGSGLFGVAGSTPPAFVRGIVGTTFKLKAPGPAGTCTFVAAGSPPDSDGTALMFADIKSQIEAAIAGTLVLRSGMKFVVQESTPTNGITVDKTGTSNPLLGFDTSADTVGKMYKPSAISQTPPCWVWSDTNNENMHVVYTWE